MGEHVTRERDEVAAVAAEALRHLAWLADAGVTELARAPAGPAAVRRVSGERPARAGEASPAGTPPPAASAQAPSGRWTVAERGCGSPALLAVREELGDCARCRLGAGRTNLVFGVGSAAAELMFVGEGPGADEDRLGEPFVGRAGQLLTKMIEAMGFRREEVYIANVVKCRPPENRNPEPDEVAACEPFLRAQIAAVRPRAIVALGKVAAQALLRDPTPIGRLRGRWFAYEGTPLMPTFHPAYLLRSPDEKKKAWEDLQLVMRELGKDPTRR